MKRFLRRIISETEVSLIVYKKEIAEGFSLEIRPSEKTESDFFLENLPFKGARDALSFFWIKKEKIRARISFGFPETDLAHSLPSSPFGGVWTDQKLSSEHLELFIQQVVEYLSAQKIRRVLIVQPPKPYVAAADLIGYLFFKMGFHQRLVLSQQFFLGKKKILKEVKTNHSKVQKVLKGNGLKLKTEKITNFGFLEDIKTWNRQRGYDENIDENKFIQQVSLYPERYFLITVLQSERRVATAIAVKLTSDGLFYYKSSIDPSVKLKQGGDLILHQLFLLAADLKVNFIDLGSSDCDSGANHSLIFFKSRFSNDTSNKISWELNS